MRRAGTLFTLLALLAVQAPWLGCDCGDGATTPTWFGPLAHAVRCLCEHADGADHDVDCAHHHGTACSHGHDHDHGHTHDHGHDHDGWHHYDHHHHDDVPPHDHEPHVAFHMQLSAVPASVTLEAARVAFAPLALLVEPVATTRLDEIEVLPDEAPPGDPVAPSVRTERLLL